MQTPKPRPGSLNVPQKQSLPTTRTARKIKTPGSDSDSSPYSNSKTTKDRSSKVADRKSPRVLAVEKKRSSKVSELESQIVQLQEELKKAKYQLSTNEPWRIAQQEADEAKKQLAVVTAELEETKKELEELSECEDARVLELRKISQERDRAWQSELEAIQKQHELDSSALASAINEMRNLKIQLDRAYQSGASQARYAESAQAEIHGLRLELTETILLVEKLKAQLNDSRESEARAIEEVTRAQMQLEISKTAEKTLPEEHARAVEAYNSLLLELEQSKNRINSLEELVDNLRADRDNHTKISDYPLAEGKTRENWECNECDILRTELSNMKNEMSRLRSALEDAEIRYQGRPPIQGTMKIKNAYELMEHAKSELSHRAAEMEIKLKESVAEVEELRTKLIEKEQALQSMPCQNNASNEDLEARLLNTEVQLQSIGEENKMLKSEITRAAENESLMKLGSLTEEADESFRKAAQVTEQLDAAQAANSDMEAELRKLKVQCNQWRKAAEAATAMLSTGDHGKYGEKAGFFDYLTTSTKFSSPQSDDTEDESPKKKNGNMLKRIGVLLKKGQK